MRIILLSIAFLFLAFSAQSQVLKSAGVWYFLDVDSMTARPAVLPNGTELAYVVGTKKIYYWDRTTSTWTEYSTGGGSSFNRDSIYFNSSIVGSGTVSDPWGIDSTLFATIAAVGDSIAAAVANYFPLEGGTLTGTGGAGFIGLPSQVTAPGTPASGLNIFAQGSSFNWKGTDGFERQITSSPTGGRNYALPDINGTFALGTGTADRSARWSATNTLAAGNFTDNGTKVQALLPFQLQQWTTAGRPAGTTGYTGYNTTGNGMEWYQGSRWAYALESTFARGTSTYVPHFDANGQIIEDTDIRFDGYRLMLNYTNYNNIIGRGSGREAATGTYNNVVGGDAGASLTSGVRNNFFGAAAGYTTTSGSRNNFFGENAGFRNTTGGSNNFFGQNAGFFNTTGGNNIFFGTNAGYSNTTGQRNIFIGEEAGYVGTTTSENVFLGYRAGRNNNGGTTNVFIGTQSGFTNTSGYSNFFAGNLSGFSNTTGYYNFFLGVSCGYNNTTGFNNFYSGEASGFFNTIGSLNVGIGKGAGYSNTTGSNNNAIGQSSGFAIVAGNNNNTFGQNAGRNIRNGINNIAIGYNAGYSGVATDTLGGDNNVLIGYQAGDNINLDADRNIVIGNVDLPTATGDNQMTIGNLLFGTDMTGTGTIAAGKLGVLTASPTQEFDADGDAYIRDSLRVGTLPRNTDTKDIAISDNSGWLGKRQFLITSDSIGEYNSWGYFVNNNKVAFQTSDNNSGVFFVGDTTAYASLGTYRDGAFSGNSSSVYNTSGSRYYKIDQVVQNGRSSLTYNDTQFWTVDFSESSGSVMAADSSGTIRFFQYGTGDKEAGDLGLGAPTHLAAFTTGFEQGTIVDLEIKRDTTIFLTEDIDYDFSAAVTTAQISRRYNRIIIHMTLTSGAGADKTTTLHTPDANLMQCEILIRGTDNTGTYDNEIAFGTNNAISSDGTNASGYTLAQGQGLHVRVVYNGSAYKYIYY